MAGSYGRLESELDERLLERIEGLKLLAHYLDEPIVIFNPQMQLVYANPSADRMARDCPLVQNGLKDNLPSAYLQQAPCDLCPGKILFEGIQQSFKALSLWRQLLPRRIQSAPYLEPYHYKTKKARRILLYSWGLVAVKVLWRFRKP